MPTHQEIYSSHAAQYELLVSREDYQHNILRAISQIVALENAEVIELGAGTGRLTCLLSPIVRAIAAFDSSQPMLDVAADKLRRSGLQNWKIAVADHRLLPAENQSADVVIAGWSLCYLVEPTNQDWQTEIRNALKEMKRVVRPDGYLILLETLGTGFEKPTPPEHLKAYYALLAEEGFSSVWTRTDYYFHSVEEAEALTDFFFGAEIAERVRRERLTILPECTGVWWLEM